MSKDATISKFSFFKRPVSNTWPSKEMTLDEAYQLIKGDSYKTKTMALRDLPKEEADLYKKTHFDYICPSGTFSSRKNEGLKAHSGGMVIDLDRLCEVEALKKALLADQYFETELLFISPSGNGLKWFVSIDLKKGTHYEWFMAISNYIKQAYGLEADPTGKDVARACFLCWDKDVYIRPDYLNTTLSTPNNP